MLGQPIDADVEEAADRRPEDEQIRDQKHPGNVESDYDRDSRGRLSTRTNGEAAEAAISATISSTGRPSTSTVTSRLAIERLANGQESFDFAPSAAGRQVGTAFARGRVGGDLPFDRLDAGPQPDDGAGGAHAAARFEIEDGPAAGGDHQPIAPSSSARSALSLGAEARLAVVGEDFANRAARPALDLGIGVDRVESQAARPAAERRSFCRCPDIRSA